MSQHPTPLTVPGQEVRLEVSVEHELHDGVDGLVARADAEQLDDVAVVEALHHVSLAQEVDLLLHRRARLERLDGHGHLAVDKRTKVMKC